MVTCSLAFHPWDLDKGRRPTWRVRRAFWITGSARAGFRKGKRRGSGLRGNRSPTDEVSGIRRGCRGLELCCSL